MRTKYSSNDMGWYFRSFATSLKDMRRLDLQWEGDEIKFYDAVKSIAEEKEFVSMLNGFVK